MPIEWAAPDARITGRGTVFLAFDPDSGLYSGYWDLEPDGPPTPLEECPASSSAREVIDWGRARTPRVLIRPRDDHGRYFWAGIGEPPDSSSLETYEPDH